jgi:hypothetical protein
MAQSIRIKIPPFDSALEIVLLRNFTSYGCQMYSITKQQYFSDLWPLSLKAKRNICIIDLNICIINQNY